MWEFKVDLEVVCVDADWSHHFGPLILNPPLTNNVYRISRVATMNEVVVSLMFIAPPVGMFGGVLYLQLAETGPHWWLASHFRPARKTDISELLKLAAPTPSERLNKIHREKEKI